MKNEFLLYDLALALKKLGFDEPCVATYVNRGNSVRFTFGIFQNPKRNSQANTVSGTFIGEQGCYAPTFSQAFRWFREKFELDLNPMDFYIKKERHPIYFSYVWNGIKWEQAGEGTYEEAELACLKKLIEIVKQKKDE